MLEVMGGPPERPLLPRTRAAHGERKLERTRCLEATVRKVSVVARRDPKHTKRVRGGAQAKLKSFISQRLRKVVRGIAFSHRLRSAHAAEGAGIDAANVFSVAE